MAVQVYPPGVGVTPGVFHMWPIEMIESAGGVAPERVVVQDVLFTPHTPGVAAATMGVAFTPLYS